MTASRRSLTQLTLVGVQAGRRRQLLTTRFRVGYGINRKDDLRLCGVDLKPNVGASPEAAPAGGELLDEHEAPASLDLRLGHLGGGDEGRAGVDYVHPNVAAHG